MQLEYPQPHLVMYKPVNLDGFPPQYFHEPLEHIRMHLHVVLNDIRHIGSQGYLFTYLSIFKRTHA